uniref:Uncharacterized protein n=1 Tax=Amphilophus citrinellus TaxID=61819 RepID=A0A3Q0QTA7_AMPCI
MHGHTEVTTRPPLSFTSLGKVTGDVCAMAGFVKGREKRNVKQAEYWARGRYEHQMFELSSCLIVYSACTLKGERKAVLTISLAPFIPHKVWLRTGFWLSSSFTLLLLSHANTHHLSQSSVPPPTTI